MADAVWSPLYGTPGTGSGFEDGPAGSTPITASALDDMVQGVLTTLAQANKAMRRHPGPVLDGVQLIIFGNSYPVATGNAVRSYWDRLRVRVNPGLFQNLAVGGNLAEDTAPYMFGTFTQSRQGNQLDGVTKIGGAGTAAVLFTFYQEGLVILEVVRNSAGWDGSTANGSTSTKARVSFTNALHAMIACCRSARTGIYAGYQPLVATLTSGSATVACTTITAAMQGRGLQTGGGVPAGAYVGTVTPGVSFLMSSSPTSQVNISASANGTAVTLGPKRVGTWTTEADTNSTQGARFYTTTPGDTTTYVLNSNGGRCWFVTKGLDSSYTGFTGSAYSITVDGGPFITGTTNDQSKRSNSGTVTSTGIGQLAVDLGVLSAGFHTVVVTHAGSSGQRLYDEASMIESSTPPTVIVPKLGQISTAGYSASYAGAGASWTTDQAYNALVDAEIARWPADQSVLSWDPTPAGWDYTKHVGNSDGFNIHLNDTGAAFYADGLFDLANSLPARAGLNRA